MRQGALRDREHVARSAPRVCALLGARRYDDALAVCNDALEHEPNAAQFAIYRATALAEKSRIAEAVDELRRISGGGQPAADVAASPPTKRARHEDDDDRQLVRAMTPAAQPQQ